MSFFSAFLHKVRLDCMSRMNRGFSARELVRTTKLGHSCGAPLAVGAFLNKLAPNGPSLPPLREGERGLQRFVLLLTEPSEEQIVIKN